MGRRSFDAQFLSRKCAVFDVAQGAARTLDGERDNLAVGDWQTTPQSNSNGPVELSDVIQELCLKQMLEGSWEKSCKRLRESSVNRALNGTSDEPFKTNSLDGFDQRRAKTRTRSRDKPIKQTLKETPKQSVKKNWHLFCIVTIESVMTVKNASK